MAQPASAMMKETADLCRKAVVPAEAPVLRKLLDLAACDLEAASSIFRHNIEIPNGQIDRLKAALKPLAALAVPEKPTGNAGAYSIRFTDIQAAKAALSQ
ncbi:MAG TPA: hypothetical protein VIR04_00480 [Paralcaligenes sp.]